MNNKALMILVWKNKKNKKIKNNKLYNILELKNILN